MNLTEYQLIVDAVYRHAWLISERLSLYSSLGNHTVAESVGLIFAGAIFRNTNSGCEWLKKGLELLKAELYHQILEDGGPVEQSINYHRFVVDLYWVASDFLEKNDLYKCSEFKDRLIQAESFIMAFSNADDGLPSIGDSDDGYAVAPGRARLLTADAAQFVVRPDGVEPFGLFGVHVCRDDVAHVDDMIARNHV